MVTWDLDYATTKQVSLSKKIPLYIRNMESMTYY